MTPKKVASFAIGPLGNGLLSLASLPLITWLFSQDDVGRLSMLQVSIGCSVMLFSLGLDQVYVREYHEFRDKERLFQLVVFPGLAALSLVGLIVLASDYDISLWLFGFTARHLTWLVVIAVICGYLYRFFSLVLRMEERGLAFSVCQLLPKLVLLAVVGGCFLVDSDLDFWKLAASFLAGTATATFILMLFVPDVWRGAFHTEYDFRKLREMLQYGLPLIFSGLAFWGMTAMDRVFLRGYSSFEELGLYAVAVGFAGAASILQSVFSTVWMPMVYKWKATGEGLEGLEAIRSFVLLVVVVAFSLAGLLAWVFVLVVPEQYADAQWIMAACMAYPLLYTLSETTVIGIGITKKSYFSMVAAVVSFGTNLLGNWVLVPTYGAEGAAVSTALSFWCFFVLRTEFSVVAWESFPRRNLHIGVAVCVIGAVATALSGEYVEHLVYGYWGSVLIAALWFFKSDLATAVRYLRGGTEQGSGVG